eukprot:m.196480 g.196480  ORF g.196480 m.196480 type:complete len:864 (-) comp19831_c0_seq1:58-2649(-)
MHASVVIGACSLALIAPLCASALTITGDTPWVVAGSNGVPASSVDEGDNIEPIAYQLALRDVQLDWYRVLGHPPPIQAYPLHLDITVHTDDGEASNRNHNGRVTTKPPPPPPYTGPVIYAGTLENNPWLASSFDLSRCQLDRGAEAHCVLTTSNGSIVVTGNTTRGAMYALYEFSEKVLGVDPWWRFTDNSPAYLGSIDIDEGFASIVQPPAFVYRGVFTNDEDLLGYFRLDPAGETVFDLGTWNQIYETLLRAKCNMIIPGTSPNPDERHIALANRRGLTVSQSHFEIVNFGALMWLDGDVAPRELYNWTTNPDAMAHTWKAAIAANADKDMIWTVGLRGLWDYTYCPGYLTDAECGGMLSSAISNQTQWIRTVQPDAKIIAYLWSELLGYFKAGVLKIPPGVKVIFTDAGKGKIGGLDDIHLADGLYYHTMMLDGSSNQLTEMISPSLVFSQLYNFVANASQLYYIVDNVSDMLPVPISTSALMKFAWDPSPFITNGVNTDWNATQREFLFNFTSLQFGDTLAQPLAMLYDRYFNLPQILHGNGDEWLGESLGRLAGGAAGDISSTGSVSNVTAAKATQAMQQLAPSLPLAAALQTDVDAMASQIPPRRVQFFRQHLAWQTACANYGYIAVNELAQSVLATTRADAINHVNASLAALDSLFAAQRAGEGRGQWSGVYFGDRLEYTALQSRRRSVLQYQAVLLQAPKGYDSGKGYYSMYQYQHPAVPNYPLFYYSDEYNLRDYVLMNITGLNTADGGTFQGGHGTVTMLSTRCRNQGNNLLPPGPGPSTQAPGSGSLMALEACKSQGVVAVYTLDGSDPTDSPTATTYSGPFNLSKTTTIRAVCVVDGAPRPIVHNATFTAL